MLIGKRFNHPASLSEPLNYPLGNKPIPFEFTDYSLQLGISIPNLFHVGPGPSSVLRVRCSYQRFTVRGPWPGSFAPRGVYNGRGL